MHISIIKSFTTRVCAYARMCQKSTNKLK